MITKKTDTDLPETTFPAVCGEYTRREKMHISMHPRYNGGLQVEFYNHPSGGEWVYLIDRSGEIIIHIDNIEFKNLVKWAYDKTVREKNEGDKV
jgi:hypothetical protein